MSEAKWKPFEWIWTKRADEFFLCHVEDIDGEYYLIMHVSPKTSSYYVIEDDEAYRLVKQKMMEHGIRIVANKDLDTVIDEIQNRLSEASNITSAPLSHSKAPLLGRIAKFLRL